MSVSEENDRPVAPDECIDAAAFAGGPVAVAVSGGPDSMALLWLLSQVAQTHGGAEIHALTVDHGLRPEAAAEAAQVGQWVKSWPHVKHAVLKIDSLGRQGGIMENARAARYDLLADHCRKNKTRALFVAHHLDDQAETFLFRLAKGSGLDGLAAMRRETRYDENLIIMRPLLDIPKSRLIATCRQNSISFVADPTNDDTGFARNRLRAAQDVLAAEGLTPKRLAVTAARMARARAALEHYAGESFRKCLVRENNAEVVFSYKDLREEPAEIRLRALLMAVEKVAPDEKGYGPRRERIEELADALFAEGAFRKRTLGGCVFSRDSGAGIIIIEREGGVVRP